MESKEQNHKRKKQRPTKVIRDLFYRRNLNQQNGGAILQMKVKNGEKREWDTIFQRGQKELDISGKTNGTK